MGKDRESAYWDLKRFIEGFGRVERPPIYENNSLGLRYKISSTAIEISPLRTPTENSERIVFQATQGLLKYIREVSAESLVLLSDPQKPIIHIESIISEPFDDRAENMFRMIHEGLKNAILKIE